MSTGSPSSEWFEAARLVLRAGLAVFSAALVVLGLLALPSGIRERSACFAAQSAEVLDASIDVGAVGQYNATLRQSAAFPCRQYIRLVPDIREGEDVEALLKGLNLTVLVRDQQGEELMTGTYPARLMWETPSADLTIADARPFPLGEYPVSIEVVSPAPAMAGRPVRVVSGYLLCGLEWIGPSVAIAGGTAAVALGAIISVVLVWTRRKS
ncbi:MAG: hypothetical protein K2Y21_03520 [Phycisphaerales bacterium]|nr:hypothetical protein [Phycisphaerales bacterium]